MYGLIFKIFFIAIGAIIILYLAASALRRARRLDTRIQEFKEELEANKNSSAVNPYAALAELYAEEPPRASQSSRRSRR